MKMPASKEQIIMAVKKAWSYAVIVGALLIGFSIGRYTQNYPPEKAKSENPYMAMHSVTNVSIAVNESNELLLIDRTTGKYEMYSDSIGMSIFKMYSNRIYQTAKGNE